MLTALTRRIDAFMQCDSSVDVFDGPRHDMTGVHVEWINTTASDPYLETHFCFMLFVPKHDVGETELRKIVIENIANIVAVSKARLSEQDQALMDIFDDKSTIRLECRFNVYGAEPACDGLRIVISAPYKVDTG